MTQDIQKTRVAVLFGGPSAEHQVSLRSAYNVINAMDRERFDILPIAIDRDGKWYHCPLELGLEHVDDPRRVQIRQGLNPVHLSPGGGTNAFEVIGESEIGSGVDVVFPVLHGPLGEDGGVQGLLRCIGVPFVGSSTLGSALCMDKDLSKRILLHEQLPTCSYMCLRSGEELPSYEQVIDQLGTPVFVKPANMGSSVGVSKVKSSDEWTKSVKEAFAYDDKILVERFVPGRELEVAVLGNHTPKPSVIGSYESKYIDENGAGFEAPANLDPKKRDELIDYALKAYKALECRGLARVDFFLTAKGDLYINEVNTLPGFNSISMYPKLWALSGLNYTDLITQLIDLALER